MHTVSAISPARIRRLNGPNLLVFDAEKESKDRFTGIKYDSPAARDIPTFIEFHGLNIDILDPLDSFRMSPALFYDYVFPLAPSPDDPYQLVSAADCRFMAFESVCSATQLWIKGCEFIVARLLGDAHKHEAERYTSGALAIFRLAPQDYQRFHSPGDGTIGT
ncbi:hypothetical protein DFH08DRAFT_973204 [Mycena albidolilacea]|uniref:Uncharacterized protein n=1 Tax=Mycena albidolilacea TaxID=1033008 RepID=A0AAD6Z8Z4_9AGAR|nr:hypothetical protein DFH08DRAFT_973204 [Mycena albidolilacea]